MGDLLRHDGPNKILTKADVINGADDGAIHRSDDTSGALIAKAGKQLVRHSNCLSVGHIAR